MLTLERNQVTEARAGDRHSLAVLSTNRWVIAAMAQATRLAAPSRDGAAPDARVLRAFPLVVPGLAVLVCASILLIWAAVL